MTINARPNLNGNTRRDFGDAYKALLDVQKAIRAARAAVMENVANGRNYQHIRGDNTATICADRQRLDEDFNKALALCGVIGSDIADACDIYDGEVAA